MHGVAHERRRLVAVEVGGKLGQALRIQACVHERLHPLEQVGRGARDPRARQLLAEQLHGEVLGQPLAHQHLAERDVVSPPHELEAHVVVRLVRERCGQAAHRAPARHEPGEDAAGDAPVAAVAFARPYHGVFRVRQQHGEAVVLPRKLDAARGETCERALDGALACVPGVVADEAHGFGPTAVHAHGRQDAEHLAGHDHVVTAGLRGFERHAVAVPLLLEGGHELVAVQVGALLGRRGDHGAVCLV